MHFIGPLKPSLTLLLKLLVKHYTHPNLNPKTNANIRQICYVIGVIIGKLSHCQLLGELRQWPWQGAPVMLHTQPQITLISLPPPLASGPNAIHPNDF